jgi:hypothetical protein
VPPDVMDIFPNGDFVVRLVGAMRAISMTTARAGHYLSEGSMVKIPSGAML